MQLRVRSVTDHESEYRQRRQEMLEIACGAEKNKFPRLTAVIGIAIDAPKFANSNSEDFILIDCQEWPDESRTYYEEANRLLKFFETDAVKMRYQKVQNFPEQ